VVVDNPRVKEYILDDVEPEEQGVDKMPLKRAYANFLFNRSSP